MTNAAVTGTTHVIPSYDRILADELRDLVFYLMAPFIIRSYISVLSMPTLRWSIRLTPGSNPDVASIRTHPFVTRHFTSEPRGQDTDWLILVPYIFFSYLE